MYYLIRNFTKNYCRFGGRASQTEFNLTLFFFHLVATILCIAAAVTTAYIEFEERFFLRRIAGARAGYYALILIVLIIAVISFLPLLSLCIRRLHDVNRPSGDIIILFIPLANLVFFYWMLLPSYPKANRWGEVPANVIKPGSTSDAYGSSTKHQDTSTDGWYNGDDDADCGGDCGGDD